VETSYAKMDIMLKQIRSMKIGADHETVAIDLQSGALYFDGMDDYLDAGNPPSLQLSTNFTLTAWIRPERTADSSGIITKSHG